MNRTDEINRIFNKVDEIRDKVEFMLDVIANKQKIDRDNLFKKTKCNVGTTLNNKFVEINNLFKSNGIDFYNDSILKNIIESDLMKMCNDTINILSEYLLDLNLYNDYKFKTLNFLGFRSRKEKKQDKERIYELNSKLSIYLKLNNRIKEYSIKEDIVDSIIRYIDYHGYNWYKKNIGTIEKIEDELDALSFNELVFILEKELKKKNYIDILPNSEYDLKKKKKKKSTLKKEEIIILNKK